MKRINEYFKLLRVHHYIKNLLVLVALACSGRMFSLNYLFSGIIGFVAFCSLSSVVYIINDIKDVERDRNHPKKCKRPIAAETISKRDAIVLSGVLLFVAIICNGLVFNTYSTILLVLYFLLNVGYSFRLKNIPIIDVAVLVSGFLIRVLYGACITDTVVSKWLYLCVISLSFFFAFGKRRNELRNVSDGTTRAVLRNYTIGFLDKNMYMCLGLAMVFYSLWSMDSETIMHYQHDYLVFTVPIVLLIAMKYSLNIEYEADGDPVEVLLDDKILILLCLIYITVMLIILYL